MRSKPFFSCGLAVVLTLCLCRGAWSQADRSQPFDPRLRTSPEIGNVQGIQRFGQRLRSDPDAGVGYTHRVFPLSDPSVVVGNDGNSSRMLLLIVRAQRQLEETRRNEEIAVAKLQAQVDDFRDRLNRAPPNILVQQLKSRREKLDETKRSGDALDAMLFGMLQADAAGHSGGTPSAITDSTASMLGAASPQAVTDAFQQALGSPEAVRQALSQALASPQGIAFENPQVIDPTAPTGELFHQPLIQIKVRVVEVTRADSLEAGSILDYVASHGGKASLISANTLNGGQRNLRGATRLPTRGGVIGLDPAQLGMGVRSLAALDNGSGALTNLTSKHINWIANLLAVEFSADVVTAPEVTTLNGQNVEFVAGRKLPFPLGLNFVMGQNRNEQTYFYKHVGTIISVTPRIVNWGAHAEGQGSSAIVGPEVHDWNGLAAWMLGPANLVIPATGSDDDQTPTQAELAEYAENSKPIPLDLRSKILHELNRYPAAELREQINQFSAERCQAAMAAAVPGAMSVEQQAACEPVLRPYTCSHCSWKPEECTIDLEVFVRLSDTNQFGGDAGRSFNLTLTRGPDFGFGNEDGDVNVSAEGIEENIRAVSNVLQVKSGHGVVMAGIINERDGETIAKVPVLGDLPLAGFLFRSKETTRDKVETLIFIEAAILPPPEQARYESARDFALSQPYIQGELLNNPLEYGMYRQGFGTYLPPHSHDEQVFWERLERRMRKVETEIDDALE